MKSSVNARLVNNKKENKMNKKIILSALTAATMAASWGANATLEPRLNGQAYYDTETDLTWTANMNPSGYKTINEHLDILSNWTVDGIGGWRIPIWSEIGGITLNNANCIMDSQPVRQEQITATFTATYDDWNSAYWYNVQAQDNIDYSFSYALGSDGNYYFAYDASVMGNIQTGFEGAGNYLQFAAWPVHTGDVAAISQVPEPGTYAMLLAGLGLIGFIGRRKNAIKL